MEILGSSSFQTRASGELMVKVHRASSSEGKAEQGGRFSVKFSRNFVVLP